MRYLLIVMLCEGACVRGATAQTRFDLFGAAGYSRITEDDGALGDGAEFGGGVDLFLTDRTYLEAHLVHQRIGRDLGLHIGFNDPRVPAAAATFVPLTLQRRGGAIFAGAGFGRLLARGPIAPFIASELGFMHYAGLRTSVANPRDIPTNLEPQEPLTRRTRGTDALTIGVVAGVRLRAGSRWFVRPQIGLRQARVENFGPKYVLRFGLAGGMRW